MIYIWNEVLSIINQHGKSKDMLLSVIDEHGTLYSINPEMRRVLNVNNLPENKINLFDHVHPEHIDGFKKIIRLTEETQKFYPARLNVKNGHYHSLQLQVHPLPFSSSKKKLFLCIGNELSIQITLESEMKTIRFATPLKMEKDITADQMEKKLEQANEKLLLLSRATRDAIWEWDMRTGLIFRNDALMNMIGYAGNDTNDLAWWFRRIHPDDRNRVCDKIKDATDKGLLSWEDEYRFKCADGDYKDIHDYGYIIYENGLPVNMICALHDVSLVKSLQNQLTKEKLERQQELSETVIHVLEQERTRLGYELHDNINQLLFTAKLFMDMLKPTEPEQDKLKGKTVEYLLMAIEEIRKLSKELVVPQLKKERLTDSIRTMIDDINISDVIKIKFTHDYETDLLSPGKKVTLFRIVQEQLKNILNYSQSKSAEVYLHRKGEMVTLIIKDYGVGFDPEQTRKGIGLSGIFERTRFYSGTVSVDTAPGRGCTITVKMPFA